MDRHTGDRHEMQDEESRLRAATTLRKLKQQARELAEREAPPHHDNHTSRRKAVRSAFISRQTGRHYARLLAQHLATLEEERDEAVRVNKRTAAEVRTMRLWVNANTPPPARSFIDDVIEGHAFDLPKR